LGVGGGVGEFESLGESSPCTPVDETTLKRKKGVHCGDQIGEFFFHISQ